METLGQDIRYALRKLRTAPGFAVVAVLTLALGIGASTAIFSVVENILLEPFPYADVQRYMSIQIHDTERESSPADAPASAGPNLDYVSAKSCVRSRHRRSTVATCSIALAKARSGFRRKFVTPGTFEFLGMPALFGRDGSRRTTSLALLRFSSCATRPG